MAKRLGTVVKFKKGVTKEQAAKSLAALGAVLDFPESTIKTVSTSKSTCKVVEVPFEPVHLVHEYEDEHGGPVWYIP